MSFTDLDVGLSIGTSSQLCVVLSGSNQRTATAATALPASVELRPYFHKKQLLVCASLSGVCVSMQSMLYTAVYFVLET